jgi:hypothetical protein
MQLLSHMLRIDVDIVPDMRPTTCVKTDEKRSQNETEWMSAVARRFEQRQRRLMYFFLWYDTNKKSRNRVTCKRKTVDDRKTAMQKLPTSEARFEWMLCLT